MEKVDEIRREVVVEAPIERVWRAVTAPDEISKWFGDVTEIDLWPGGGARFGWTEYGAEFSAEVVTVEEPFRFSYRWTLDSGETLEEGVVTLVEFSLDSLGGGTRVTVVESGFSALPDGEYEKHFKENSDGWSSELEDLRIYLAGVRPIA